MDGELRALRSAACHVLLRRPLTKYLLFPGISSKTSSVDLSATMPLESGSKAVRRSSGSDGSRLARLQSLVSICRVIKD